MNYYFLNGICRIVFSLNFRLSFRLNLGYFLVLSLLGYTNKIHFDKIFVNSFYF